MAIYRRQNPGYRPSMIEPYVRRDLLPFILGVKGSQAEDRPAADQ
jgi:hypothetical protein